MSAPTVSYTITFHGKPTVWQLQNELETAADVMGEDAQVQIYGTVYGDTYKYYVCVEDAVEG